MSKPIVATGTPALQASPMPSRKLAALYCRVSTPGQEEDGTSLDTQEERCRQYATLQGYTLDDAYIYREVYTGTDLWQRPRLTALREAIRHGRVTHLVAYAIDRLSRDPVHLGVVLSEAEHHGVSVEFVSEPLDDTPEGQLIRFVRGYAARIEVEKIRERALRGKRVRLQNGKIHSSGIDLYGYRRDKERGIRDIYQPEAAIVRAIFHWYVEEKLSLHGIVKRLNDQGVMSPSVNKMRYTDPARRPHWGRGQIHRILREPAYKGMTISWRYDGGQHLKPDTEWLYLPEGVTPALVPEAVWNATQERRASNTGAEVRNQTRPQLLRGMVECAVCGRKMRPNPESRGRYAYRCASRETPGGRCGCKRVPAAEVELWAWEQVCTLLLDPSLIADQLQHKQQKGPDQKLLNDKDAMVHAIAKLERQQAKLVHAFRETEEEKYPLQLIQREIAQIEKEKAQMIAALSQIEESLVAWQLDIDQRQSLLAYCQDVAQGLENFDFAQRRLALEALGVTVIANGREWRLRCDIILGQQAGIVSQSSG